MLGFSKGVQEWGLVSDQYSSAHSIRRMRVTRGGGCVCAESIPSAMRGFTRFTRVALHSLKKINCSSPRCMPQAGASVHKEPSHIHDTV